MADKSEALERALPDPVLRRGVTEAQWMTLCNSLFPGANPQSVLMVLDYCKARNLDPMKKPCHIVPMEIHDVRTNSYVWRDVILPGIYEYRITAHRTGVYLGHGEYTFGPPIKVKGVTAPEWCDLTVYRWSEKANQKVPFPVRVYFEEVVAFNRKGEVNARWTRAPKQMLMKCTEAAGLREALPEEFGGEPTAEEMDGQRAITIESTKVPTTGIEGVSETLQRQWIQLVDELGLTDAQRLVRENEFLASKEGKDLEESFAKLIQWATSQKQKKPAAEKSAKAPTPTARTRPQSEATPSAPNGGVSEQAAKPAADVAAPAPATASKGAEDELF